MDALWEKFKKINFVLKQDFLCIPPYRCVTGQFVKELMNLVETSDNPAGKIISTINNPSQRAYQMEYRYKQCDIFTPYLPVVEYATYDAMDGNWICAYLSLLPVVEAVLRKWADVEPDLTFNKMKGFAPKLIEHLHNQEFFPDERIAWSNSHIEYLQFILCDLLYDDFDTYGDKHLSTVFNRNLSLHKLEGVMDLSEGLQNISRILLVLDIIAELYFMQTPPKYWDTTFYANPSEDVDFQLRWKIYKKHSRLSLGPNDLLVIYNAFLNEASESEKKQLIYALDLEEDLTSKVHQITKEMREKR